ncbi:hypothetical protein ACWXVM_00620 [Mycoplasma sp. 2261]
MKKYNILASLLIPSIGLLTISCNATSSIEIKSSKNVQGFKANEDLNPLEMQFDKKITKTALEIKKTMRTFNYAYYTFFENYDIVKDKLKELIEEQSISQNKDGLTKYYNSFWHNKNPKLLNDFSRLLDDFYNLFNSAIKSLSNLNFYLEQFKFDNDNLKKLTKDQYTSKLDDDFKQYIYNKDFADNIYAAKKIPIKNLMIALKEKLAQISTMIKKQELKNFLNEYHKAKIFIYDNINHVNLDVNIDLIISNLEENNQQEFF